MLHELYLLHLYSAQEGAYKSHCYFTKGSSCLLAINIPLSVSQIDLSIPRYLLHTYTHTTLFDNLGLQNFYELISSLTFTDIWLIFKLKFLINGEWIILSFLPSRLLSFRFFFPSFFLHSFIQSLRYSVCQPVSQLFRCCFVKNDMTFLWLVVNCMREITAR